MTTLRISGFGGIIPRLGKRLLPDNNAQYALNAQLYSGELRAWNVPQLLTTFSMTNPQDWYHYRTDGVDHYMAFDRKTDVVKAPIINDAYGRLYLTNGTAMYITTRDDYEASIAPVIAGVPEPVFTSEPTVVAPQLGAVPQPTFGTAPTVTAAGGTATLTETRVYAFVLVADDSEEGDPTPANNVTASGNSDGTWTIAHLDTLVAPGAPYTKLRVYRSPVVADVDPIWRRVVEWDIADVPASYVDTIKPTTLQDDDTNTIVETRVYTFILVSKYGEEGPPNADFLVTASGKASGTWVITGLDNLVAPGGNVAKLRVYRTITSGGSGVAYRQVVEWDLADVPHVYNDDVSATVVATNPLMQSIDWEPPPLGLSGLCAGPGGMLAAFKGSTVYFSVPFYPHAWPNQYQLAVEDEIVAMGWVGTMLVIGTTGRPAVVMGSGPSSLTLQKFQEVYPCLSARSLVSTSAAVMFASLDGLMAFSPDGANNVTAAYCTRKDWLVGFSPSAISGAVYQNRYFGFYSTDLGFSLGFDDATTGFTDLQYPGVTLVHNSAVDNSAQFLKGSKLYQWDGNNDNTLFYVWRSKPFMVPKPCNMGVLQVRADFPPGGTSDVPAPEPIVPEGYAINDLPVNTGPINGYGAQDTEQSSDTIGIKIYGDDKLRYVGAIRSEDPVRLPSGFKCTKWEIEVSGSLSVFSVVIAGTAKELEDVP